MQYELIVFMLASMILQQQIAVMQSQKKGSKLEKKPALLNFQQFVKKKTCIYLTSSNL